MRTFSLLAALPAALTIAACADSDTSTAPSALTLIEEAAPAGDRLATVELEKTGPALYLQNADGSGRVRVHFEHVEGHVRGNYTPRQLPVTDESIIAISRAKWSPDGRSLAVVVMPAYEAAQVVLISADGRSLRTVSPNSQYMWSDVAWSPDSRQIAYVMATGPCALLPDLFVTELGADWVRRITTSGAVSGPDVRFDQSGGRIFFGEKAGWAPDGFNTQVRLATVDLATGAVSRGDTVVGEPQGFARDGAWALFRRVAGEKGDQEQLARRSMSDGTETVLAGSVVIGAVLLEGDREAVVVTADPTNPDVRSFSVIGVDQPDDVHETLPTPPSAMWAALLRSTP
jgi:Tol biopolymer transport system component